VPSHQLFTDILPLYVVLMLVALLIMIIHRQAPTGGARLLPSTLGPPSDHHPDLPTEGQWFFNYSWQLRSCWPRHRASAAGRLGARQHSASGCRRRRSILGTLMSGSARPDATRVPEPKLLFIAGKTFVTAAPDPVPGSDRVLCALSADRQGLARLVDFCRCWAETLQVFCTASVFSLAGQILRFYFRGGFVVDTILAGTGIIRSASSVVVGMATGPKSVMRRAGQLRPRLRLRTVLLRQRLLSSRGPVLAPVPKAEAPRM
jgi:hypothetical protein